MASEPVQPVQPAQASAAGQAGQAGHGLGTLPTSSFALEFDLPMTTGAGRPAPRGWRPDDETGGSPATRRLLLPSSPTLPEPDQTSSPAPPAEEAPAAPSDMPSASEETPESSSSSEPIRRRPPRPRLRLRARRRRGAPRPPRPGPTDRIRATRAIRPGRMRAPSPMRRPAPPSFAQDSSTRTIGGLLAFTGAGAALVLGGIDPPGPRSAHAVAQSGSRSRRFSEVRASRSLLVRPGALH